jgi:hypothetical protein
MREHHRKGGSGLLTDNRKGLAHCGERHLVTGEPRGLTLGNEEHFCLPLPAAKAGPMLKSAVAVGGNHMVTVELRGSRTGVIWQDPK